jgi:hydroxymethylbilane synthase
MITEGDRILDKKLELLGGKGLFTKELEQALMAKEIDLAVHSLKDMATVLPAGLTLACVLKRLDPRDAFINPRGVPLHRMPQGATIGTSSLRRQAQILALRPDLSIHLLRGNVETRLKKIQEGEMDGTLLALAGLERLGLTHHITEILSLDHMLPAVGQGALGIECRQDDDPLHALLAALHHEETGLCITSERAFLRTLDGSCRTPIGGYATLDGKGQMTMEGLIAQPDGKKIYRSRKTGPQEEGAHIGQEVAEDLLSQGGSVLLSLKKSNPT